MKKTLVHVALILPMVMVMTASASSWIQTNWPTSDSYFSLYTSQDKVFARIWDSLNGGRVFLSADNGANWTQISSADSDIDILSIVMLDSNILAGTWDGFYLSTDSGTTWNAFTATGVPTDTVIWSMAMMDTTLFAGTTGDIYKSSDNGNSWTEVGSGITVDARITSIVTSGGAILAGSAGNGVFRTTDGVTSWTAINSGITDTHISQLAAIGTRLLAVTLTGVFISENNGTSWSADSSGLENINCFVVVDDQLFAGTDDYGVYLSVDSGATWTLFSSGLPANTRVWSLAASSGYIFAGTDSGVWRIAYEPTAVTLQSFTATGGGRSVALQWETATEIRNLGFNLYRAERPNGPKTKLNETLIDSGVVPGSFAGARYQYRDTTPQQGRVRYYWLETVSISGETHLYGPVVVRLAK